MKVVALVGVVVVVTQEEEVIVMGAAEPFSAWRASSTSNMDRRAAPRYATGTLVRTDSSTAAIIGTDAVLLVVACEEEGGGPAELKSSFAPPPALCLCPPPGRRNRECITLASLFKRNACRLFLRGSSGGFDIMFVCVGIFSNSLVFSSGSL